MNRDEPVTLTQPAPGPGPYRVGATRPAASGYSKVRGINAILASVSTDTVAPVVIAQRLRKGHVGSSRGVTRLVRSALATVGRTHLAGHQVLVRADSAFYSRAWSARRSPLARTPPRSRGEARPQVSDVRQAVR